MGTVTFGGTPADYALGENGKVATGVRFTVWDARVGGSMLTQVTQGGLTRTFVEPVASGVDVGRVDFDVDESYRDRPLFLELVVASGQPVPSRWAVRPLVGWLPVGVPLGVESMPDRVLTTNGARPVGKGELVVNVKDFGAVGDGVTDDGVAIRAAIDAVRDAGGGTALMPYTAAGYASGAINLYDGVRVLGDGGVTIKRTGAATAYFINAPSGTTDATLEGVTIDGNGLCTVGILNVTGGATNITIRDVTVKSSVALTGAIYGLALLSGCSDVLVQDCRFTDLLQCIRVAGAVDTATIRGCTFTGWGNRAIFVIGTAADATSDLTIEGNTITDVDITVGDPRQPIGIQSSGAYHKRVSILGNRVVGNGLANHQGQDGGALLGGTADQISMHYCEDSIVARNHVADGGEAGITISVNSRRVTALSNTITGNNTTPFALGTASADVWDVAIVGNVMADNGRELAPPTTGDRTGVHAAVWCQSCHGVVVTGNTITDSGGGTQQYVTYLANSDGLRLGVNNQRGLLGTLDPDSAGYTDATQVSTIAL